MFIKTQVTRTENDTVVNKETYSVRKLSRSARGIKPIKLRTNTHSCKISEKKIHVFREVEWCKHILAAKNYFRQLQFWWNPLAGVTLEFPSHIKSENIMVNWQRKQRPHEQQAFADNQDLVCLPWVWKRTNNNIASVQASSHVEQEHGTRQERTSTPSQNSTFTGGIIYRPVEPSHSQIC